MLLSQASQMDPRTLKPKLTPGRHLTQNLNQGVNLVNSNQVTMHKHKLIKEHASHSEIEESITSRREVTNPDDWGSTRNQNNDNHPDGGATTQMGTAMTPMKEHSLLIPSAEFSMMDAQLKRPPGISVEPVNKPQNQLAARIGMPA